MRIHTLAHAIGRGWAGAWPTIEAPERTVAFVFGAARPYLADPEPLQELSKRLPDIARRMGGDLSYRREEGRTIFEISLPIVAAPGRGPIGSPVQAAAVSLPAR